MQLPAPDTILAKTNWARVALIHVGVPACLILPYFLFSDQSLEVIFSRENLLATTRWRDPYVGLPAAGLAVAFLTLVPLLFAFRRGKMIWTDQGLLRAPYFQSFPLIEIEGSSLRLLNDKFGTELIFVLRSGGEGAINLFYAKYDGTELVHRIRDLVATAQRSVA